MHLGAPCSIADVPVRLCRRVSVVIAFSVVRVRYGLCHEAGVGTERGLGARPFAIVCEDADASAV